MGATAQWIRRSLVRLPSALLILFLSVAEFASASFHEENISQKLDSTSRSSRCFGKCLRSNDFFQLDYMNFNHGSFGACPRQVLDYQDSLRFQQEAQPDVWFRKTYYELQNQTRKVLAEYVGLKSQVDQEGLVLVESASTAVNAILRSFPWSPRDVLVKFSLAYPMVSHTASWIQSTRGVQVVTINITTPIVEDVSASGSAFLDPMREFLDSWRGPKPKLFVLDHIVSSPAVREPVAELVAMIKQYYPGAFVLVDGAHCVGQIKLDLPRIGNLDAYLSNGHKWLYSPKGSAFLWVNQTSGFVSPSFPEPTVISSKNAFEEVSFSERFSYVATRDYTAILSLGAALAFREQVLGGDAAIYAYCRSLAVKAKQTLLEMWKTESVVFVPYHLEELMINVPFPSCIQSEAQVVALMEFLLTEHRIYMTAKHDGSSGVFYTRLSSQVYLELADFELLGSLVLEFCGLPATKLA